MVDDRPSKIGPVLHAPDHGGVGAARQPIGEQCVKTEVDDLFTNPTGKMGSGHDRSCSRNHVWPHAAQVA